MKMSGVIFSNIYDSCFGSLTSRRAASSIPFGGRYRMIDFILSNMVNSDISKIGVIAKYNYSSLMDHLHYANDWDLERKHGGLYILPPFGDGNHTVYKGKMDALGNAALNFLKKSESEYVVVADSTVICSIDFSKVLKDHIKSGCDITCIANREDFYDARLDLVFEEENGVVKDVLVDAVPKKNDLCGMGMFIMKRTDLLDVIEALSPKGCSSFEREFIQSSFYSDRISVNVYEYSDTVLRVSDIPSYYSNSMKLLKEEVRNAIFKPDVPIYTKIRNEAPSLHQEGSKVSNSIIADGCNIMGTVENSILFRGITVEPGAVIKNSIVMQGSVVEKNAFIDCAILDKDVRITKNTNLKGAPRAPLIIDKGLTV